MEFEFLGKGLKKVFGSRNDRILKTLAPIVGQVNALEPSFETLSDTQLREKTTEFRARLKKGETLDDLAPEAFAACREASKRALGMRHFDVQLLGGLILHQGKIAEMTTGEGKTLTATLAVYLNALAGKGVHLVTVNDYLARRDEQWMSAVYRALGMTSGAIQAHMPPSQRIPAYRSDITYGTNSEFGFDYLRDNMKFRLDDQCQQARHNYAIVDEVDSILIDEARTPLIISGSGSRATQRYYAADEVVKQLVEGEHYEVNEKDHNVVLTEEGMDRAQELVGVGSFYDPDNIDWPHHIDQALKANYLYKLDKNYVVDNEGPQGPEIVIVDEFSGRKMRGRRWSDGLHQAVEAKEGLSIREENQTLATITYQNFFRLYDKLAGMTGTAKTEAAEFLKIYDLDVIVMPTNRRMRRTSGQDLVYRTEREKFGAVVNEIERVHAEGRPVLVGTTSVEKSERLAKLLVEKNIEHELLNAKHHEREATIVAKAGQPGAVTISTNMAGRGTDILLGPGVKELGGLHVVGTERHEARRIDNQLRGRAGRQGDPGSSQFFLSLEDDLMRIFAKDWVGTMLQRLGLEEGQEIQSTMVTRMIERVQKKMEAHHFDIRKNLLEYDKINNDQRSEVYRWRQAILEGKDQHDRVQWAIEGVCALLANRYMVPAEKDAPPKTEELRADYHRRFDHDAPPASAFEGKSVAECEALLCDHAKARYEERRAEFTRERMEPLERYVLMQTIDDKWKDHLQALDYLRTGVGMRGYGQEDPKIVYTREARGYWEQMVGAIQEQVVDLVFHMKPSEDADDDSDYDFDDDAYEEAGPPPARFDWDDWGPDDDDTDWDAVAVANAKLREEFEEQMRAQQAQAEAEAAAQRAAEGPSITGVSFSEPGASVATPVGAVATGPDGASDPDDDEFKRLQEAGRRRALMDRPAPDPLLEKGAPNPNDVCPCGSGRKFKKCHGG